MASPNALTKHKKTGDKAQGRTALITAPLGTDTSLIRRILSEEGVRSFAVDEVGRVGESLEAIIEEAMDQADMVLAVLPEEGAWENVLIELGFALASKKPILVLAAGRKPLPSLASGLTYLRGPLDNEEALRFGLTIFLSAPRPHKPFGQQPANQTRPLGGQADDLLARLTALPKPAALAAVAEILAEAIRLSGVTTLATQVGDAAIDVAVWSDDLEPWISNPLLILVKDTLTGKGDLDTIVNRFRRAHGRTQPGWGLVLYRKAAPGADLEKVKHLDPTILFLSAEDFLTALRTDGFGDLILRLRNDRMHGRG